MSVRPAADGRLRDHDAFGALRIKLPVLMQCAIATALITHTAARIKSLALPRYTNRLCSFAAAIKLANSGCGSKGRDFSSGWYCTPMNQG